MKNKINSFYQEKESIQNHYQNIAQGYNTFWNSIDKLVCPKIIEYLELNATDNFVDLGCGTGLVAKTINNNINFVNPVVCVDMSEEMLKEISSEKKYKPIVMDVVEFAAQGDKYDKILVKGMIHHINDKQKFLSDLFNKLTPNGILLIVMHPPTVEHPLFKTALNKYEELQPHYESIDFFLKEVGFKTKTALIEWPISINKSTFIEMVQNRYMSFLSSFKEEEIQAGIREIEDKFSDLDVLKFPEKLIFITARK